MVTMEITSEIKKEIMKLTHEINGELFIQIGNCRLDFSKTYKILGFTKKTIKLAWQNGRDWIPVQGKIEDRNDYLALYTESWSYIEHLTLEV